MQEGNYKETETEFRLVFMLWILKLLGGLDDLWEYVHLLRRRNEVQRQLRV
jgi:hypothetical protein